MKPTVMILVSVLAASLASAQSPSIIQNTRNTMNGVSSQATAASNQALGVPASTSSSSASASTIGVTAAPSKASAKSKGGAKAVVVTSRHKEEPKAVVTVAKGTPAPVVPAVPVAGSGEGENAESEQSVVPDSKYAANGRRDPFISPVVSHAGGSGCSTGKKCLEIGTISLRGVVRSENGFIAVVSNGMNKAYFLRENDPVFSGYVVKITNDSIVFQETLQDRLGKTFTREVTKKITTPAV